MKMKLHDRKALPTAISSAITMSLAFGATSALGAIEEVVVTAEKRAENVQDIGLSVTGLDKNALEKAGVGDVTRITDLVPGVNFAFIGNDAKFNVRGANSNNTFGDNASIVGVFADGVYKARASQQTRQFYDIERVEFLRGPQGTLYGRNTFAGAMNLYTNKPDLEEVSAGVDLGISRFNKFRTEGFLNLPVSDVFAVRVAGFTQTSDGYVDNLAGPNLGEEEKAGIRLSGLWDISDTASLVVRYSYSDEGGSPAGVFSYAGSCRPVDVDGLTDPAGGQIDCQNPRRGGAGGNTWDVLGPYTVENDFVPEQDLEEHGLIAELNVEFSTVNLKSITSYTDYESLIGGDGDFSGNPNQRFFFEETAESFTQEFQLTSNNESDLQWTAGLYYSEDTVFFSYSEFRHTLEVANPASVAALDAMGNPITVPIFTASSVASLDTNLNGFFADANEVKSDYFGAFFQAEFSVTDTMRLIAGIRYNEEDKSARGGSNFSAPGARPVDVRPGIAGSSPVIIPSTPGEIYAYNLGVPDIATSATTYDNVSWRAGLEFDLNDDVMLYATASTGFLSGAVNARNDDTDEQESQVIEIGIKSRFLDNTLQVNAAAHYTEYTNLLAQLQTVEGGVTITSSRNGGEIEASGLEVEVIWAPTDELTITGNIAFLDSEYGQFGVSNQYQAYSGPLPVLAGDPITINGRSTVLGAVVDVSGQTTPWSPEVSFNIGGSYVIDLEDAGTVTPSIQLAYSDSYNVYGNFPVDPLGEQDSFTKTDARVRWDSVEGNYSLEIFIENIEDEEVNSRLTVGGNDFAQTSFAYPRNWGLRAKARF